MFLGHEYLITVQEGECPTLRAYMNQLRAAANPSHSDLLFYKVMDGTIDAYAPTLDWFNEAIDDIEDTGRGPSPTTLQRIFEAKRGLIERRRVLSNMRDVAGHLQRLETELMQRDLWRFCGTCTITWRATWTWWKCGAIF